MFASRCTAFTVLYFLGGVYASQSVYGECRRGRLGWSVCHNGRDGDGGAELLERHRLTAAVHGAGRRRGEVVRLGVDGATASAGDKQVHERVAELLAHGAVEEEVDAVVDERQDVEQVAETGVHLVDEVVQQPVQQVGDALWKLLRHGGDSVSEFVEALWELCDQEQDDDEQQHACGARVGPGATVVSSLATPQHLSLSLIHI